MTKSIKQKWAQERCFLNYGSLLGIEARLRQIAKARSTTSKESVILMHIADRLNVVTLMWLSESSKKASKSIFTLERTW